MVLENQPAWAPHLRSRAILRNSTKRHFVETGAGDWAAFEVKLSPAAVDDGARSLLKFANVIDTAKCGPPSVLASSPPPGTAIAGPTGSPSSPSAR